MSSEDVLGSARSPERALRSGLELAVRAPSLHNSQPWRWRMWDGAAQLYLDLGRRLPAADPDARELVLSCGAGLHHLVVGLAGLGYGSRLRRLPDPDEPTLLARVELTDTPAKGDAALAAAIPRRRTDRRRLAPWPLPPDLIGELTEIADLAGLSVRAITEPTQRLRVYRTITRAARLQAEDPAYIAELESWSGRGPAEPQGVPAANAPAPGRVPGQPPMRQFARPRLAQPESPGEPEGAALLMVSTPTDAPLQWLRAGEVTSAILLTATRNGLATTPLSQPLEVPETRDVLRSVVGGGGHPQILLRIGWPTPGAAELPATSRRPLAEVVAGLDEWRGI
jgi:nitroreductase